MAGSAKLKAADQRWQAAVAGSARNQASISAVAAAVSAGRATVSGGPSAYWHALFDQLTNFLDALVTFYGAGGATAGAVRMRM